MQFKDSILSQCKDIFSNLNCKNLALLNYMVSASFKHSNQLLHFDLCSIGLKKKKMKIGTQENKERKDTDTQKNMYVEIYRYMRNLSCPKLLEE